MKTAISFVMVIFQTFIQAAISEEWLSEYIDFTIDASYIIGAVVIPAIFMLLLYKGNDTVAVSEDEGSLYKKLLTYSTIISLVASVIIHWLTEEDLNKVTFTFSAIFSVIFATVWFHVLAYFGRKISINLQYYSYNGTTLK